MANTHQQLARPPKVLQGEECADASKYANDQAAVEYEIDCEADGDGG